VSDRDDADDVIVLNQFVDDPVGAATGGPATLVFECEAIASSVSSTAAATEIGSRSNWRRAGAITTTRHGASVTYGPLACV
jgi:hypothetical protein